MDAILYNSAYTAFIRNSVAMGKATILLARIAGRDAVEGPARRAYNAAYLAAVSEAAADGDIDSQALRHAHFVAHKAVR